MSNEMVLIQVSELRALMSEVVAEGLKSHTGNATTTPLFKYLSCIEAAKFLGKTPNSIRVMVCKNQLKSIKRDSRLYFREADLIEYLEAGSKEDADDSEDGLKKKGVRHD